MSILYSYANGYTDSMTSDYEAEEREVTRSYSSFSPASTSVLNKDTTTLFAAYFNYSIYSGKPGSSTYTGDGYVTFYGNNTSTTLLNGVAVEYDDRNDQRYGSVKSCVDPDTGEFDRVYARMTKSWFAGTNDYYCGFTNLCMEYYYLPYKLTLGMSEGGSNVKSVFTDAENNIVKTEAIPKDGYHFVRWSDGVTDRIRTDTITGDTELYAEFAPNQYTVQFCDITSGTEIVIEEKKCQYDNSEDYLCPALPTYDNIPEGHSLNPIGWTREESGLVRYGTTTMYDRNQTILTQYTTFSNLTTEENGIVKLFCNFHPYQYTITYRPYELASMTYTPITEYRIYGEGDYTLKDLVVKNKGYKLTNQMNENDGPVDQTITNAWFVSNTAMNPGDSTITTISSTHLGNMDLYSYEVPINYTTIFHIINFDGTELSSTPIDCIYNEDYITPSSPEELEGRCIFGWYKPGQDISTWYISPNSNTTLINSTSSPVKSFNETFYNCTDTDHDVVDYYAYYIPKAYTIDYEWIDNWGQGQFPTADSKIRVWGRDEVAVAVIPSYDEYDVHNVGTVNWYVNVEKTDVNTWDIYPLDLSENIVLYGFKTPKGRNITFEVNDKDWGEVIVKNPLLDNIYPEGYLLEVEALPLDNGFGYFSNWSDGNREPIRIIEIGGHSIDYIAYFRSRQIFTRLPEETPSENETQEEENNDL